MFSVDSASCEGTGGGGIKDASMSFFNSSIVSLD